MYGVRVFLQIMNVICHISDSKVAYLPSRTERVTLFFEFSLLPLTRSTSLFVLAKYTGLFGTGSAALPFSKMNTTVDISGLSMGLSCTDKSPMWMQSKASYGMQLSIMLESTKSFAFPSFHWFHASIKQTDS